MTPIHLGISTCPNDTFTFHGILEEKVNRRGLDFQVELLDVEELNQRLFAGDFDVAKASFHAALRLAGNIVVLPVGSALGFGVGPLLLAALPRTHPRQAVHTGQTTATLLYRLFHHGEGTLEQAVFSAIMPALTSHTADFGVCIHEGRFTWREHGLALVEDLGHVWEQETDTPLPLGGILARPQLGRSTIETVIRVLADSLAYALAHRDETVSTMRRYAQELTTDVMFKHVDLYVNQWTTELGPTGRRALDMLGRKATEVGIISTDAPSLEVF